MHITSLPGPFGIGTFGKAAYDFVDFLVETKQTYWQLLPLSTTSYGDSPYQSFSAIAGNTHLIDFEMLKQDGLLDEADYQNVAFGNDETSVDYARIYEVRRPILEKAVTRFLQDENYRESLKQFERDNHSWLQDYAEFMAIKEYFNNKALQNWDDPQMIARTEESLKYYRQLLSQNIFYHKVVQYLFFSQWSQLKEYANNKHIKIIGDMPIYVSVDSVEVWLQPELFKVDDNRKPLYVAGVPADNFSADGQLWGNPLYDWEYHKETGYKWWVYRIQESFKLYDVLRIDHFKGFSDYWQVDGNAEIAKYGSWEPGPGYDLFRVVKHELGDLDIIAEDLGNIDDKARQLLDDCGYPGMKILQFGFYDTTGASIDIPHCYTQNSIAYTGTHDNEVINGWYDTLTIEQQQYVNDYISRKPEETIAQAMLRTLFATVSNIAIAPMQDILGLDASSRMNTPSTLGNNWKWRMQTSDLTQQHKNFLTHITQLYQRGNIKND